MKKTLLLFALLISISYVFITLSLSVDKNSALKAALQWGGLAALPSKASNLTIQKKGSIFTRQIIIEFDSDSSEIKQWIDKSKRLQNNIPQINKGIKVYEIYPGENGAFGGKVEINQQKVHINMCWS